MTQILTHTPLWVFGLFFGLVYLGYLQSRTRQVSRGRLIVLPLAMLAWSLYSVWSTFDAHLTALAAWACAWVAVVVIGLAWVPSRRVAYDVSTAQFTLPGSWMPLALMMGIFFFRYAVAVIHGIRPGALDTAGTVLLVAGAYGLFSGLFMARAMGVLVVVRQGGWWRGAPDGARAEST
ncbi:DUF6622 family protein [Pseudoxanthomonas mexicana]|uniref:DUF6622 family protein n=1 Tax=Pseudoxanthomonas mexicana TaxID=128785 RepID=UPI0011D44DFC|nr:DUF6622 family protein [Pseudoxanthomonas mexicana]TXH12197.1 MAG: hypothetical protein E6R02_05220 [Gammaproteobacteria bacterium]